MIESGQVLLSVLPIYKNKCNGTLECSIVILEAGVDDIGRSTVSKIALQNHSGSVEVDSTSAFSMFMLAADRKDCDLCPHNSENLKHLAKLVSATIAKE